MRGLAGEQRDQDNKRPTHPVPTHTVATPPTATARRLTTFGGAATASAGRPCPGLFDVCPGASKCVNPAAGNEWCFWLKPDKANCVCT